jgi:hypothetical protein
LDADPTDNSQVNMQNTRFTNYMLSNYFSESTSDSHVQFAVAQKAFMINSAGGGVGIAGSAIDDDSTLLIKTTQDRALEKLQLSQRPFLTVPYLGKGSCDPALESQLLQGEMVADKKSVSTVMDKSFMNYALYPTDSKMEEHVHNPANTVEEAALSGWVRGGASTRDMAIDQSFSKTYRPTDKAY